MDDDSLMTGPIVPPAAPNREPPKITFGHAFNGRALEPGADHEMDLGKIAGTCVSDPYSSQP